MASAVMRRLILLRHGQTHYNATGRMQGQLDTDLSEIGIEQAARTAHVLAAMTPRAIISSDLRRALHTATPIAEACGLSVHTDQRLRETHLGQWQGMPHGDVDAHMPGARMQWRDDPTWCPPGGESRIDVADRSTPVVTELLRDLSDWGGESPVILVAHGGVISAMVPRLMGLPVQYWPRFGGLGNTSWVQMTGLSDGDNETSWRLDVWNASTALADVGVQ